LNLLYARINPNPICKNKKQKKKNENFRIDKWFGIFLLLGKGAQPGMQEAVIWVES